MTDANHLPALPFERPRPLAGMELQAVFSRPIPRFPTLHLAVPVEELRVRGVLTGGLAELPVRR